MDRPDRHFKINEKSVPNIYVPEVPPRRPTAVVGPRPHVAHEAPREQVMKKQKPKSESVDDDPTMYAKADAFISQLSKSLPGASSIDKTENFNLNDAEWCKNDCLRDYQLVVYILLSFQIGEALRGTMQGRNSAMLAMDHFSYEMHYRVAVSCVIQ